MKSWKGLILVLILPLFAFSSLHKYYVSVTKIDYIKETQAIQITSRIFIDDFEKLLRGRYDEAVVLNSGKSEDQIDIYIEKYLKLKLQISINKQQQPLTFIGKAYEDDKVVCYLEIENIQEINQFEIKNQVLFDMFKKQRNIVRTFINDKNKTFVLLPKKDKGLLSFKKPIDSKKH
jgi:hypothetical protein